MKKIVLGMVVAVSMVMFAGVSMAANTWDNCDVERIGVSGDNDNVFKVGTCYGDPSGTAAGVNTGKWLMLYKQKDTSMATLLTAFSLGNKVKIQADFDVQSYYKPVESIFMNK